MRETLLKQQLEAKIKRLEKEKWEAAEQSKDWQEKYGKLVNKTLQKDRETLQKKTQKPPVSVPAPSAASQVGVAISTTAPLVTASVVPTPAASQATPTATVKPMPASVTRMAAVAPTAVASTSDISSGVSQEMAVSGETVTEGSGDREMVAVEEGVEQETEEPEVVDQLEEGEIPRSGSHESSPMSAHPGSSVKRPREEAQSRSVSHGMLAIVVGVTAITAKACSCPDQ